MARVRSFLRRFFTVPGDNMELVGAQYAAFSKQIPLLYFVVVANSLAVCFVFYGLAPSYLTVYVPGALCLLCTVRCVIWIWRRNETLSNEEALDTLRAVNRRAVVISAFFVGWALALYPYGDAYNRGQVAFYIALTVVGCTVCLMHVRSAALLLALTVNTPYIIFFLMADQTSLRAMAVNIAIVTAALIATLFGYHRDFANLVHSRVSLIERQAETQRLSDENLRLANQDSLTGLSNRRSFFNALERAPARAAAAGAPLAIGVIDLDGFKTVNDTYGHLVGDRLLMEAAQRMQICCDGAASIYRLGGDEFALIVEQDVSPGKLVALGRTIIAGIRAPFMLGKIDVRISASIGFAVCPDSADTPARLYERADYALYHAKRRHRGEAILFSAEHEEQIRKYGAIELAMQSADFDKELALVFQPIVDARTGRPLAMEALARWTSPTLGPVSPATFIPVAERNGLIRQLTKMLLRKALAAAAQWPEHIKLSFNLSAHDISAADGVLQIIDIIQHAEIAPRRIDFEITETAIAQDFEQAKATIKALKAMGAGISLDDFGSGYSSFSHVRALPLDKIKVDRSFIVDIATNKTSHDIVKSLQSLCADVGIACVVEGVELAEQMQVLADIGCNIVQGFYFSRPIAESEVAAYLENSEAPGARAAAE